MEFVSPSYGYFEDHGEVTNIQVQLSHQIANNITITLAGGPGSQPSTVVKSGVAYSSAVTFPPDTPAQTPMAIDSFMIMNDDVGRESVEEYQLMFTGSSRVVNINLGQPTMISITDEDG